MKFYDWQTGESANDLMRMGGGRFRVSPFKTSLLVLLAIILTVGTRANEADQTASPSPQAEVELRALSSKYPKEAVNLLLERMRAVLPKGWSASYDKEYSVLEISRDESVLAEFIVINAAGDEKPERTQYAFSFRVLPAFSPEEYRRLFAENVRIQEELKEFGRELEKRRVPHIGDNFYGETDEEKAAVARYEALRNSRPRLPDYHFGDISLEWIIGAPAWDGLTGIHVIDDRIREDCARIRKKMMELLSPY